MFDACFEVPEGEGEEVERDDPGAEVEVGESDGFDGVGETVWWVDGLFSCVSVAVEVGVLRTRCGR